MVLVCSKAGKNFDLRHRMQHLFMPEVQPFLKKLPIGYFKSATCGISAATLKRFEKHCIEIFQKNSRLNDGSGINPGKSSGGANMSTMQSVSTLGRSIASKNGTLTPEKEAMMEREALDLRDYLMSKDFVKTALAMKSETVKSEKANVTVAAAGGAGAGAADGATAPTVQRMRPSSAAARPSSKGRRPVSASGSKKTSPELAKQPTPAVNGNEVMDAFFGQGAAAQGAAAEELDQRFEAELAAAAGSAN